MADPHTEYRKRLEARQAAVSRITKLNHRLGYARLATAVLAAAAGWLIFDAHAISPWTLLIPAGAFIGLVVVHTRLARNQEKAERAVKFYERGIERLEGRWSGRGDCGEKFLDNTHPYAIDLDLFGRGSLFELLCTGRTLAGRRTLSYWLLHPAPSAEIRARQEAVEELRAALDLREDLAVMGEDVRRGVHAGALPRWGEAKPILEPGAGPIVAGAVSALDLVTFLCMMIGIVPETFFIAVLAVAGVVGYFYRARVLQVIAAVEQPAHDIGVLAEVLARLEGESFASRRLVDLQQKLETDGDRPSKRIARLKRLLELLDSRDHVFMRLIGPPLMWSTQLAFRVEAWRRSTGPSLRRWLTAVGEFEALSSLASYAYEHPDDPFPVVAEEGVYFRGEALGHPLIPEASSVRNDVTLDAERQVLLVSGSNMSGKSTLLRTLGTNAVLAMAGGPVRARSLEMTPLSVGASIRVTDSLQSGVSRFYAEITRIRQLMDLSGSESTLLFLMDELLHGTNSHDRLIGAEAIVRRLVGDGAIGLVTTHDLAITHIEEELAPRVRNVHFQDHLEDGQMKFDYRLRPGIVEHSNAIELMRSVGLEV